MYRYTMMYWRSRRHAINFATIRSEPTPFDALRFDQLSTLPRLSAAGRIPPVRSSSAANRRGIRCPPHGPSHPSGLDGGSARGGVPTGGRAQPIVNLNWSLIMKRRAILAMVAALFAVAIAAFGGTSVAHAQCPNDCTFLVNASCSIPPACFPIKLTTNWTQGAMNVTQNDAVRNCGGTFFRQPMPCPPIWNIGWASLDGGATKAFPNGPAVPYVLPGCNFRVCLTVTIAPGGCVNVNIFPC